MTLSSPSFLFFCRRSVGKFSHFTVFLLKLIGKDWLSLIACFCFMVVKKNIQDQHNRYIYHWRIYIGVFFIPIFFRIEIKLDFVLFLNKKISIQNNNSFFGRLFYFLYALYFHFTSHHECFVFRSRFNKKKLNK